MFLDDTDVSVTQLSVDDMFIIMACDGVGLFIRFLSFLVSLAIKTCSSFRFTPRDVHPEILCKCLTFKLISGPDDLIR